MALRRVDEDVVPALWVAQAAECKTGVRRIVARHIREHRCSRRDVVAPEEARRVRIRLRVVDVGIVVVPLVDVHPRLAVRKGRHGHRCSRLDHRGVDRGLDLSPRRPRIVRAPDAACVRGRIDNVRVRRVEDDLANTAGRAVRDCVEELVGPVRGIAEARVGPAVMDQCPRGAAVCRLVKPPLSDPRHGTSNAGAANRGHAAERRGRPHVDRVRIARLDHDRADALALKLLLADRTAPRVAGVGRFVEAGARDATGPADVRLAGPHVDGVPARVVRVDVDRASGVNP